MRKVYSKVIARSHNNYSQFFEFIVSGEILNLEDFVLQLSKQRKKEGYTGEFLSDLQFTNFVLIYSSSPLNVTPTTVPANRFNFEKIIVHKVDNI